MTFEQAIAALRKDGHLFDTGQLGPEARRKLRGMSGRGEVIKTTAWWPYLAHGTAEKTIYVWNGND